MAKFNKQITKKLEQSDIDDWMCEQLNAILNNYFYEEESSKRISIHNAIIEISLVMNLSNRRKTGEQYDDYPFSDYSRSNYKFNPAKTATEQKETVRRFPVQPEQKKDSFSLEE